MIVRFASRVLRADRSSSWDVGAVVMAACGSRCARVRSGRCTLGDDDGRLTETDEAADAGSSPVKGVSAMPCGLVFPGASAKDAAADWLPEVWLAAPEY